MDDDVTTRQLRAQIGGRESVDRAADADASAVLDHRGGARPAEELGRRAEMKRGPADRVDEVWNRSVGEEELDGGRVALDGGEEERRKCVQVLHGVQSARVDRRRGGARTAVVPTAVAAAAPRFGVNAGAIAAGLGGRAADVQGAGGPGGGGLGGRRGPSLARAARAGAALAREPLRATAVTHRYLILDASKMSTRKV